MSLRFIWSALVYSRLSKNPCHPITMIYHNIDPIAFYVMDLPITWYWLFYPIGFFAVFFASQAYLRSSFQNANSKDFIDFVIFMWFAVIIGGRLGYFLFYQPRLLFTEPFSIFEIWRGGMSFHGAFLACVLTAFSLKKYKNIPIYKYGTAILLFLPIALFLGRIGNFINGELWGRPSDLPWAMVFSKADTVPRHPSQIYEALLEGPILFLSLWFTRKQFSTVLGFVFFYGAYRFIAEFTREADRHIGYFLGLSIGQYFCLFMMFIALFFLFRRPNTIQS
jgi:phosphatidylglycerol---prolipoprotein diacylglyceryl transferase